MIAPGASLNSALRTVGKSLAAISPTARLDAEVLLCHVLGRNHAHLRAWPEKLLQPEQARQFSDLAARRLNGEPVAYLTGSREFWSREFRVTPEVLIPRPETELLVELALERIPSGQPARIADLGAGSGVLAISLALERPRAEITAVDFCPHALAVARDNARRLGAANVHFHQSDWFAALPAGRFDLIVSNPPYVASNDPHLSEGDLRFEPRVALSSGADGLDAIRRIIAAARDWLAPDGVLLLEHGHKQAPAVQFLLTACDYRDIASRADLQGHPRVTLGRA